MKSDPFDVWNPFNHRECISMIRRELRSLGITRAKVDIDMKYSDDINDVLEDFIIIVFNSKEDMNLYKLLKDHDYVGMFVVECTVKIK